MKSKQIIFTDVNTAELLEAEEKELGENEVLIKTAFSTISCGTERANIIGDINTDASRVPAENNARFPRMLGYSSSGIVEKVGSMVKSVSVGDRVAVFDGKHKSYNIMPEENVVKCTNEKISLNVMALSYIASFSMAAVRKTKVEAGEPVIVMGLGILGQFAAAFAKASGAVPVIAVDPVKKRREKALQFGADFAFDPFEDNFAEKVKSVTDGGAAAAIEVTGTGKGFDQVLDCMKKFGRVALLGCTRDKNFTIDYYRKIHFPGITVIGAHTCARPERESYSGYFTHRDDIKAFLKLCEFGRINPEDIIDEVCSPNDCKEVYERLVHDKDFPIVVQFDWSEIVD